LRDYKAGIVDYAVSYGYVQGLQNRRVNLDCNVEAVQAVTALNVDCESNAGTYRRGQGRG